MVFCNISLKFINIHYSIIHYIKFRATVAIQTILRPLRSQSIRTKIMFNELVVLVHPTRIQINLIMSLQQSRGHKFVFFENFIINYWPLITVKKTDNSSSDDGGSDDEKQNNPFGSDSDNDSDSDWLKQKKDRYRPISYWILPWLFLLVTSEKEKIELVKNFDNRFI